MVRGFKILVGSVVGLLLLLAGATTGTDLLIGYTDPPVGHFIDTSAGRQHIIDVGPDFASVAGAPTIVLLHGATANLQDMRLALADRLRASYRVIAIDRPGHGWSERADGDKDASPVRQAAVIHEILRKAGVEHPILLAHSWAGSVALDYALAYPREVSGLVLLAPVAYRWAGEVTERAKLITTPWLGSIFVHTLAVPIAWASLDRVVALAFSPEQAPPDYIEHASILLAMRPAAITANAEDLAMMSEFPVPQSSPYAQINVPTLVIAGADDRLVPVRQSETIARQIPQAKLVMLKGVGHMAHYAEPERILDAIGAMAATTRRDTGNDEERPGRGVALRP